MSKEEVLRKAIEKAQANGYRPLMTVNQVIAHRNQFHNPFAIIFTHDFAKAFFGERHIEEVEYCQCDNREYVTLDGYKTKTCPQCGYPVTKGENVVNEGWQYHLQQMVISDDPLKYLEKFLDKK